MQDEPAPGVFLSSNRISLYQLNFSMKKKRT